MEARGAAPVGPPVRLELQQILFFKKKLNQISHQMCAVCARGISRGRRQAGLGVEPHSRAPSPVPATDYDAL